MTAIAKELNKKWAAFSVVWTTVIAYIVATIFYQAVTILEHPQGSIIWILSLLAVFIIFIKIVPKLVNNSMTSIRFKQIATPVILD